MDAASDAFADAGYAGAVLWMLDGNTGAERFYEATGWLPDGARRQRLIGDREYDLIRLRRAAARPAPPGTRQARPASRPDPRTPARAPSRMPVSWTGERPPAHRRTRDPRHAPR